MPENTFPLSLADVVLGGFTAGAAAAFSCLAYMMVAIGEGMVPLMAVKILFPGFFVHWPGMPGSVSGVMILVMFVVTTITNGVIYAFVAVGAFGVVNLVSLVRSRLANSK